MSTSNQDRPKRVRTAFLDDRGWTRDLRRKYLRDITGGGYSLTEAERIEQTEEWKTDARRAADNQPILFARQDLKERGWTPTMVKQFLGEPDLITSLNSSGTRVVHQFFAERVEQAEQSERFAKRREVAAARSKRGKAITDQQAEETRKTVRQWADSMTIKPPATLDTLRDLALRHQEELYRQRDRWDESTAGADPETVERWCRNYLRHKCTDYDRLLNRAMREFAGTPGVREIYEYIVRPRVDALVADTMDRLREESGEALTRTSDR